MSTMIIIYFCLLPGIFCAKEVYKDKSKKVNLLASFGYLNEDNLLADKITSVVESNFSRNKRDENCAIACTITMTDEAEDYTSFIMEPMQGANSRVWTKMPKDTFMEYCSVMIPTIECYDKCGEPSRQLESSLQIPRLECIDHYQDILDNYDCLLKAEATVTHECASNACPNLEQSANLLDELIASQTSDMENLSQVTNDYCVAAGCSLPCTKNVTARECGEKIADIATYNLTTTFLTTFRDSFDIAGKGKFPDMCEKVLQDSIRNINQSKPKVGALIGSKASKGQPISFFVFTLCLFKFV